MALVIGLLVAAFVGIYHHFALRALDRVSGHDKKRPNRTLITVFLGLLAVHFSEILIYAGVYTVLLEGDWAGRLAGEFEGTFYDQVYFSGINFATLGYTQIEADGPIRMISMLQSLTGFMILTWSATFIYSAWEEAFR